MRYFSNLSVCVYFVTVTQLRSNALTKVHEILSEGTFYKGQATYEQALGSSLTEY